MLMSLNSHECLVHYRSRRFSGSPTNCIRVMV